MTPELKTRIAEPFTADEIRIAREYAKAMRFKNQDDEMMDLLSRLVRQAQRFEPRINCGLHVVDWLNICDEDDDFDSFYGSDYFDPRTSNPRR